MTHYQSDLSPLQAGCDTLASATCSRVSGFFVDFSLKLSASAK